jgi:hypothetical protein
MIPTKQPERRDEECIRPGVAFAAGLTGTFLSCENLDEVAADQFGRWELLGQNSSEQGRQWAEAVG